MVINRLAACFQGIVTGALFMDDFIDGYYWGIIVYFIDAVIVGVVIYFMVLFVYGLLC